MNVKKTIQIAEYLVTYQPTKFRTKGEDPFNREFNFFMAEQIPRGKNSTLSVIHFK